MKYIYIVDLKFGIFLFFLGCAALGTGIAWALGKYFDWVPRNDDLEPLDYEDE